MALSRETGQNGPGGIQIDERTDIYSVGAIPVSSGTGGKIGDYRDKIDVQYLSGFTGEAFAWVIEKALQIDPARRYQSAYEMFRALENIPKRDRRYLRLIRRQRVIRGALTVFLAGFILLGGYGISRIRQERTDAYNDLVEKQISLIQAGSYEEQEQIFDQASELLPSALESYYQNAYALYDQEKYEECISFIDYDICGNKKLNLMQMRMADVYYLRADSYFRLGKYEDAAQAYEDVFRIGTEHTEYYRDYAIALAYAGEEKQAQKVLQQAIDYGAEDDSIYYAKGEIEKALGRLDAAIQEFSQCISLTDDSEMKARAYLMISNIYEEKGSDASRREILLKAREELPVEDQLQILQRLAAADIELADTSGKKEYRDEAIEVLTQITDQGWGTFDTLDTLAVQ